MNSHDNRAAVDVDRDVAGRPRAMPLTCQHFEQTDAAIASGTPLGEEEPPFPEDHIELTGYWTNQAQHDKEELPFPDAYSEPTDDWPVTVPPPESDSGQWQDANDSDDIPWLWNPSNWEPDLSYGEAEPPLRDEENEPVSRRP